MQEAALVLGLSDRGFRYLVHTRRLLTRYRRQGRVFLDAREVLALREVRLGQKKTGRRSALDVWREKLRGRNQSN